MAGISEGGQICTRTGDGRQRLGEERQSDIVPSLRKGSLDIDVDIDIDIDIDIDFDIDIDNILFESRTSSIVGSHYLTDCAEAPAGPISIFPPPNQQPTPE